MLAPFAAPPGGTDEAPWARAVDAVVSVVLIAAPALVVGRDLPDQGRRVAVLAAAAAVLVVVVVIARRAASSTARWTPLVALGVVGVVVAATVDRAAALSVVLGAAQLARLRSLEAVRVGRATEANAPLVALAVLTAWLSRGSGSAGWVVLVQAVTLGLVHAGEPVASSLVRAGAAVRWAIDAALGAVTAVVFVVLAVPTVLAPWVAQRLGRVDPLRPRSGRRGWLDRDRADSRPAASWAADATRGRPGIGLVLRRSFAALVIVAMVGAVVVAIVRNASGPAEIAAPATTPAAVGDAAWWPDYARVLQYLNIPGDDRPYDPFGPLRLRDLTSTYVNVVDGSRRTWTPPDCDGCRRLTVWMYGGSTTFGIGQRDDQTIASQLARLAWKDGIALDVRNRGVPADMHWEEAQRFAWDAAADPAPDLVIFYDGTNEMWASSVLNAKGWGDDESQWNPETENARETYRDLIHTAPGFVDRAAPDGVELRPDKEFTATRLGPEELAVHVLHRYEKSLSISRAVADAHHLATEWFWQPCPQSGTHVEGEPNASREDLDRNLALCRATAASLPAGVTDLSRTFDGRTRPLFIDAFHTSEAGATVAATALLDRLRPTIDGLLDGRPPS